MGNLQRKGKRDIYQIPAFRLSDPSSGDRRHCDVYLAVIFHGVRMLKSNAISKELEQLVSVHESGGGFGDPDAKAEYERKIRASEAQANSRSK